jgi:hypothetical protein
MITTLDQVQLAMPAGREQDALAYYGGLLGLVEMAGVPRAGIAHWNYQGKGRPRYLPHSITPNLRNATCVCMAQMTMHCHTFAWAEVLPWLNTSL